MIQRDQIPLDSPSTTMPFRNGNVIRDRIMMIAVAALAGVGGTAGFNEINPPAPDRFTGTQATEMRAELEKEISTIDSRLSFVELAADRTDETLKEINAGIHRIEISIHELPPAEWRQRIRTLEYDHAVLKGQLGIKRPKGLPQLENWESQRD